MVMSEVPLRQRCPNSTIVDAMKTGGTSVSSDLQRLLGEKVVQMKQLPGNYFALRAAVRRDSFPEISFRFSVRLRRPRQLVPAASPKRSFRQRS
jgi:hypothetical protein